MHGVANFLGILSGILVIVASFLHHKNPEATPVIMIAVGIFITASFIFHGIADYILKDALKRKGLI